MTTYERDLSVVCVILIEFDQSRYLEENERGREGGGGGFSDKGHNKIRREGKGGCTGQISDCVHFCFLIFFKPLAAKVVCDRNSYLNPEPNYIMRNTLQNIYTYTYT